MSDGNVVEFGTSGKLYNSNLVMYDRQSNSLWNQALGEGIVGDYSGVKLEEFLLLLHIGKNGRIFILKVKFYQEIPVRLDHTELIHTETIILMI